MGLSLLSLVASPVAAVASPLLQIPVPWWNPAWAYVRPVAITVGANPPLNRYAGYSARLLIDTTDSSRFRADCADLRIVYWDGLSNIELDRDLYGCGSSSTEVWFALQADIGDGATDFDYYAYYGNPAAGAEPSDRTQVYLWWDDFSNDPFAGRYTRAKAVDIHGDTYLPPTYDAANDRVTFDTGDNNTSDFYINNASFSNGEQDVFIQVDHFADLNYPTDATDAIAARVSAITTTSTHEYVHFSHGFYPQSPGCTIDSWTNGERNTLCAAVVPPVYWAFTSVETWAWTLSDTTHRFWRDAGTTYASPTTSGRTQLLTGTLSAAQPGYLGPVAAQSRGWWDNLLVRRYTEPEPVVALGPEEAFVALQIVDPKTDALFFDADGNGVPSAGDTLSYAIQVSVSAASAAAAVLLSDAPDANTSLVVGSVTTTQGSVTSGNAPGDTSVAVDVGLLPPGVTVTIGFRVLIDDPLPAGIDRVSNQGFVSGSNFPAAPTDDPATAAADDPTVTLLERLADELPETGFPPGRVSELGPALTYRDVGELWLKIPSLGVAAPIVGVPLQPTGWDVSWLWNQVGYLEGTAFPTWSGNTGLTGHVTQPDGTPGPFAGLSTLHWGDEVVIEAWGQGYRYEVRSVETVAGDALSVLNHEELDWVTLLTCADFDESRQEYRGRVAVRAVLLQIDPLSFP